MADSRILILGAAGRDFHVFNTLYKHEGSSRVVAFTAQQIPHIENRRYPAALAGDAYPDGIPILPEDDLEALVRAHEVDVCVMAYSDVSHETVGHLAARCNAAGADFLMPGAERTMLDSNLPVVAVCAVRTGVGKSQTSRAVARLLREAGLRVGIVRHPMPYGDLLAQRVQRFADPEDLTREKVTIEEREEYEPHIAAGSVVFAGVDYQGILEAVENDADVILWDGGNNDTPFFRPDVHITLVDPHRPGHELRYYPGETNLRLADVVLINKVDTADAEGLRRVRDNVRAVNPEAMVLEAASPILVDDPGVLEGKRVLAVEDGPTCTHGEMRYGAATLASRRAGAELVDPRPFAVGELRETFESYPEVGPLLPAMGYGEGQIRDLETTIRRAAEEGGVEAVAIGTPIDLGRLVDVPVPHTRVRYELEVRGEPDLSDALAPVLERAGAARARQAEPGT